MTDLFDRVAAVATVHQPDELRRKLAAGHPLNVKYGIDPTAVHVHLGHLVGLLVLRQFIEAGHRGVLIIGNFTARVGDPTGRDETRSRLTAGQVKANTETYLDQISRVIDLSRCAVRRNDDWFQKCDMAAAVGLMSKVTVGQLLARDDFGNRNRKGEAIHLHEMLYPLLQAYDSVVTRAEVEIGGNDQLYNLMLARDIQKKHDEPAQVCVTVPILLGLDGSRRMGKSLNNYVALSDEPAEMFAKVMSIPDALTAQWWHLLPVDDRPLPAADPMTQKKALAHRITGFLHSPGQADTAAADWHQRFTLRQDPEDIPIVEVRQGLLTGGRMNVCDLLKATGLCQSKNEARKIIAPQYPALGNSGVTVGGDRTKVDDPQAQLVVEDGMVVRVGRRRIARVRVTK